VTCEGLSGMAPIEGDGFEVCLACIYRKGRAAADPNSLTDREIRILLEASHRDGQPPVVGLVGVDLPTGKHWTWWWTNEWPSGGLA
jgi:hypothetical protein